MCASKRGDVGRRSQNQTLKIPGPKGPKQAVVSRRGGVRGDLLKSTGDSQPPRQPGRARRGQPHTDTLCWTQARAAQLHVPGAGGAAGLTGNHSGGAAQKGALSSWQPDALSPGIIRSMIAQHLPELLSATGFMLNLCSLMQEMLLENPGCSWMSAPPALFSMCTKTLPAAGL